jgi:hypothetical protein
MAGNLLRFITGARPLTGTWATIAFVKAAANHRAIIKDLLVTGDGTDPTAAPIEVRVISASSDGTLADTVTPMKNNPDMTETPQTTVKTGTVSEEPTTSGSAGLNFTVHPQGGHSAQFPWGEGIQVPGGARLLVQAKSADSVNAYVTLVVEE